MTDGDLDMQANPGLPTSVSDSLNLGADELDPLTDYMNTCSEKYSWSTLSWNVLLESVLSALTGKLASSSVKSKVIGPLNFQEAADKIDNLNEEQLNKWKEATQRGMEKGVWTDLINLSTCLLDCPLVCYLSNVTAKVKHPQLPNVAQGVPIELRVFPLSHCIHSTHPLHCRGWYVCSSVGHYIGNQICCLAVIDAWDRAYLGNAHQILLKAVDDLHNLSAKRYAKILPIVQSSGTGKSKTVDRSARERILFPMCLREELGKELFGVLHGSGT